MYSDPALTFRESLSIVTRAFGGIQEEVRFEDLSSIGRYTFVEPTPDGE